MRLSFEVSAESAWIAFRSDWMSVHMAAASCDGKIHSRAAFSALYDEVITALRCCFVQRIEGLEGSLSAATNPAPLINVPAVADTLVDSSSG